ncbi:hypothetical protein NLI96_g3824 [Meripilus lineatus]|uniref:Protein tyrosine phosphatase n=1 Tax=Meripilus lineatus TaxID=2056292 RepID=A0AAD5V856_9APHY|nr:hypothetical protein NLI96_g3824 [Physisporinus lineatus]
MLTREIESALVKCGKYWVDGTYGSMKLKLIQTSDTPEGEKKRAEREKASGFFNIPSAKPPRTYRTGVHFNMAGEKSQKEKEVEDEDPHTIRRVFELSNSDYPDVPPRIVTQLQYLEWPDLNVPEDPRGILGLMWEVEELVEKGREEGDRRWGEGPLNSQQYHQFQSTAPSRGASIPVTIPSKVSPKHFDGTPNLSSANELDPLTGIAKNAVGNPPVLLHCSAGVGRTGGFIAVNAILDGIRREMRKRKMARESSASSSNSASTPAEAIRVDSRSSPKNMESQSRASSSRGVAMEVDSSPSPPGAMSSMDITEDDGDESEAPALTMAVPVGHTQVHVPVAGFSGPLPLEVEESVKGVKSRMEERVGIIKASPDLVNEVRRATMLNKLESNASSSGAVHGSETGSESFGRGSASQSATTGSGSGSGAGSGTNSHFGSGTGSRTGSGHFSVSPVSSHTGSFASLSLVAAKNQVGPGKAVIVPGVPDQDQQKLIRETGIAEPAVIARPALPHHASSNNSQSSLSSGVGAAVVKTAASDVPKTVTVVAPSSPKTSRPHPHPHPNDTSSRLDEWRSEVLDSQAQDVSASEATHKSRSEAQAESSSRETGDESPSNGDDTVAFRGLTFDYMQPRPLHDDSSPPLLSTYDEPIRRVVEDMREQRMSLCQSLRQYVFVHRAIIEGSLMIVDEEKVRDEEKSRNEEWKASIQTVLDGTERSLPPGTVPIELIAGTHKYGLDSSNVGGGNEDLGRAVSDMAGVPPTEAQMIALTQVSPGRPKRGASPTELLHEGAKGEVRLTKRPSVKRKPRSSDEDSERAILPF